MKEKQHKFICQSCGTTSQKWFGRCTSCGLWDSIISNDIAITTDSSYSGKGKVIDFKNSTKNPATEFQESFITGVQEIDRVFGGRILSGSAILIGGEPGIGKSTLLLQIASFLKKDTLYVSGEESIQQILSRADRLKLDAKQIFVVNTNYIADIIATINTHREIKILIIDSIQTMYVENTPSHQGSVNQVKMCTNELINATKKLNVTLFIIGHVTKDGQIAGPKLLEHMVDTVLYFEGENSTQLRILRTMKNRFGSVFEIGVFEMTAQGFKEVSNPSMLFLGKSDSTNIGNVVFASIEGTRSLLVEIQTLIIKTYMNMPRRSVVGWDLNRLSMIIAVISSRCGFSFENKEVYLNVAGGFKLQEPAADLAVAASLISSSLGKALPEKTIIFGEVALSGEVRRVSLTEIRLKEAIKLGFKNAIIASDNIAISGIKLIQVSNVKELSKLISDY